MYKHYINVTLSCCVLLKSACSSIGTCDSHHLPDFDGKRVTDFPLDTYQGLEFVWHCTKRCWEDYQCRSYMFNRGTGQCSTFAVGYADVSNTINPISDEAGAKLYTACGHSNALGTGCVSDVDCDVTNAVCSTSLTVFSMTVNDGTNRRCVCDVGYSFDPSSGSCLERCAEYGEFAIGWAQTAVRSNNRAYLTVGSLDECMERCKAASFTCVNFDYNHSAGSCLLCVTAWHDLNPVYHEAFTAPDFVFFQRSCKG